MINDSLYNIFKYIINFYNIYFTIIFKKLFPLNINAHDSIY